MIHPKDKRLDYGKLLAPPDDFRLSLAIGTSYSVDLEALMVLPLALCFAKSTDRPRGEVRVDMVEAIIQATERIHLFHQQGKISVPSRYHSLMAFWERSLHEVRMPQPAASFHPKVWIVRFESDNDEPRYRLLVTSRNLTFARDYDIAFCIDGTVGAKKQKRNEPLIHFLSWLNQTALVVNDELLEELAYVDFGSGLESWMTELEFHPVGVPNGEKKYQHPVLSFQWEQLLVISPFIDKSTIKELSDSTDGEFHVLSRQEELLALDEAVLPSKGSWQFSRLIEEGSFHDEAAENEPEPLPIGLHAKTYIGKSGGQVWWYLGSANATAPAATRNIEFLVSFCNSKREARPLEMLRLLTSPDVPAACPIFERFDPIAIDRQEIIQQKLVDSQIRLFMYVLFDQTQVPVKASVELDPGSGLYSYALEIDLTLLKLPVDFHITIRPLSAEGVTDETILNPGSVQQIDNFRHFEEHRLTPYFGVFAYYKSEMEARYTWCLPMVLPQNRLNRIFSSIINSRGRFLDYLFFLLSGEEAGSFEDGAGKGTGLGEMGHQLQKPIYEQLLVAASREPAKLERIGVLVDRLGQEDLERPENERILSPDFLSIWKVFSIYQQTNSNAR